MASSPDYKVYDADGKYQAACKDAVHAVVLAEFIGCGASIRWHHKYTVWTVGTPQSVNKSYDDAENTVADRIKAIHEKAFASRPQQVPTNG